MRRFASVVTGTLGLAVALFASTQCALAQQRPDSDADVSVSRPAFARNEGPRVVIDGGHHNFHTAQGRFAPFAALLRNDGFRVSAAVAPLSAASLSETDVLVICNALNAANVNRWTLPTPSAFSAQEVAAIADWVHRGGALLLIADHLPFAGAAADLAAAFGFKFLNGFALRASGGNQPDVFSVDQGSLQRGVITQGRTPDEAVSTVTTFTGSAFQAPPAARPLLIFPSGYAVLLPQVAWQFSADTPWLPADGYLQGAVLLHGKGRVAVFGEAAMFSAQVTQAAAPASRPVRLGFNASTAPQNKQFILNLLHWLAGMLPADQPAR